MANGPVSHEFAIRFDTARTLTYERTNVRNERPPRLIEISPVPYAPMAVERVGVGS